MRGLKGKNVLITGASSGIGEATVRRFGFMGKGTTAIFLFSAGEKLPQTVKELEARRSTS